MKEKEQRLSSKKPYFPNRRSAVISIAVVISLLAFAVLAIDRNNVNRLTRYESQAVLADKQVRTLIEERFLYTDALVKLVNDDVQTDLISESLRLFNKDAGMDRLGSAYRKLDQELSTLQPSLFTISQYNQFLAYFEELYAIERKLADAAAEYNARAEYFNAQKRAFPALLVARRLEMEDLVLLNIATALKGRP